MANKRLGAATTVAGIDTTIYTAGATKTAVANINICNTGTAAVTANIKIGTQYIEKGAGIPAGGVLERTAQIIDNNEVVLVNTSGICDVRVYGIEE